VAANALATLNALAPGRVVFGVSTGYTGRSTMGLGPVPLARLEKYVDVVDGLLKWKTVDWSEQGGTHKIRFLNPDLGLINIADPIPTFVSAFGPKARALTAKLGAGWIGAVSYPQREQADIEDIRAARRRYGRDLADFYPAASTGGCVLDEGEPADRVRRPVSLSVIIGHFRMSIFRVDRCAKLGLPPQYLIEHHVWRRSPTFTHWSAPGLQPPFSICRARRQVA
jgi:5,10-methylenetetrahydromethanopterin reductase